MLVLNLWYVCDEPDSESAGGFIDSFTFIWHFWCQISDCRNDLNAERKPKKQFKELVAGDVWFVRFILRANQLFLRMSLGKQLFSDPLSWKWMCVRSSVVLHASPTPFSNLLPTKASALHRWADRDVSYLQLCLCDVYQLRPDVCVAPEWSADGAASLALLCCCSWIHIKERIRNLPWFTEIPAAEAEQALK